MRSLVLILLAFVMACQPEAQAPTLIQSPADKRHHAYQILDNGLRIWVVSDPTLTDSVAAVSVRAGSFQDPVAHPGTAHFLEHLLFLGSDRYPEPGEYQAFLSRHGGSFNAYTKDVSTTYYFEINPTYFAEAFDRLSRFFIAPRFDARSVDRECMVVDAEYQQGLKQEPRRLQAVYKATSNPGHPFAHFSVGNKQTLQGPDGHCVRAAVQSFYQQYYTADRMNVVLVGPESTDVMMKRAVEAFSALPKAATEPVTDTLEPLVFGPKETAKTIYVRPLSPIQNLILQFPLTDIEDALTEGGGIAVVNTLLRMTAPGSLMAVLKEEGLIDTLSVQTNQVSERQRVLTLEMSLRTSTPQAIDRITALTFAYFQFIDQPDIQSEIFDRIKPPSIRNFIFQEPAAPLSLALDIVEDWHSIPAEAVLSFIYFKEEDRYQVAHFDAILEQIRPDNLRRTLLTSEVVTDQVEPFYQVPYRVEPLDLDKMAAWQKPIQEPRFTLAPRTPYAPVHFERRPVLSPGAAPTRYPIGNDVLWVGSDARSHKPTRWARVLLRSPQISDSPAAYARSLLWVVCFYQEKERLLLDMDTAEVNVKVDLSIDGFNFKVDSYRDSHEKSWRPLLEAWAHFEPTPESFHATRAALLRRIQYDMASTAALEKQHEFLGLLLLPNSWSSIEVYQALEKLTWEDVAAHRAQVFASGSVETFFYGNVVLSDAKRALHDIQAHWHLAGQPSAALPQLAIPKGHWYKGIAAKGHQEAAMVYLQAPGDSDTDKVCMALLSRLMHARFYDALRTREHLGYRVGVRYASYDVPGVYFYIASDKGGAALTQRIFHFIQGMPALIQSLDPALWESTRQGLIRDLEDPDYKPSISVGRYWREICDPAPNFNRAQETADLVKSLTYDDFLKYIHGWKRDAVLVLDSGTTPPAGYQTLPDPYIWRRSVE